MCRCLHMKPAKTLIITISSRLYARDWRPKSYGKILKQYRWRVNGRKWASSRLTEENSSSEVVTRF